MRSFTPAQLSMMEYMVQHNNHNYQQQIIVSKQQHSKLLKQIKNRIMHQFLEHLDQNKHDIFNKIFGNDQKNIGYFYRYTKPFLQLDGYLIYMRTIIHRSPKYQNLLKLELSEYLDCFQKIKDQFSTVQAISMKKQYLANQQIKIQHQIFKTLPNKTSMKHTINLIENCQKLTIEKFKQKKKKQNKQIKPQVLEQMTRLSLVKLRKSLQQQRLGIKSGEISQVNLINRQQNQQHENQYQQQDLNTMLRKSKQCDTKNKNKKQKRRGNAQIKALYDYMRKIQISGSIIFDRQFFGQFQILKTNKQLKKRIGPIKNIVSSLGQILNKNPQSQNNYNDSISSLFLKNLYLTRNINNSLIYFTNFVNFFYLQQSILTYLQMNCIQKCFKSLFKHQEKQEQRHLIQSRDSVIIQTQDQVHQKQLMQQQIFLNGKQHNKGEIKKWFAIIGGGPVGLYLAFCILSKYPQSFVILYQKRLFNRQQVIRIPLSIAKSLPFQIQIQLWPNQEVRNNILHSTSANIKTWPHIGYKHWCFICIGQFQKQIMHYLDQNIQYKNRFRLVFPNQNITELNFEQDIRSNFPVVQSQESNIQIQAIFCTCGFASQQIRTKNGLTQGKKPEKKCPGIYWIYDNEQVQCYEREGEQISSKQLGKNGITYACSNNKYKNVQLYTYPVGELQQIFSKMPQNYESKGQYSPSSRPLKISQLYLQQNDSILDEEERLWFIKYAEQVKKVLNKFKIQLPNDKSKIKVFFAHRMEYYYKSVVQKIKIGKNNKQIKIYFVGDSAGSTDYKLGLSGGRGLLCVDNIVENLNKNDQLDSVDSYQKYWSIIIQSQFDKDSNITQKPEIQFLYLVKGRDHYIFDQSLNNYRKQVQKYSNNIS